MFSAASKLCHHRYHDSYFACSKRKSIDICSIKFPHFRLNICKGAFCPNITGVGGRLRLILGKRLIHFMIEIVIYLKYLPQSGDRQKKQIKSKVLNTPFFRYLVSALGLWHTQNQIGYKYFPVTEESSVLWPTVKSKRKTFKAATCK